MIFGNYNVCRYCGELKTRHTPAEREAHSKLVQAMTAGEPRVVERKPALRPDKLPDRYYQNSPWR